MAWVSGTLGGYRNDKRMVCKQKKLCIISTQRKENSQAVAHEMYTTRPHLWLQLRNAMPRIRCRCYNIEFQHLGGPQGHQFHESEPFTRMSTISNQQHSPAPAFHLLPLIRNQNMLAAEIKEALLQSVQHGSCAPSHKDVELWCPNGCMKRHVYGMHWFSCQLLESNVNKTMWPHWLWTRKHGRAEALGASTAWIALAETTVLTMQSFTILGFSTRAQVRREVSQWKLSAHFCFVCVTYGSTYCCYKSRLAIVGSWRINIVMWLAYHRIWIGCSAVHSNALGICMIGKRMRATQHRWIPTWTHYT